MEKLYYALSTFCSSQQSTIFSQHLVINLYDSLYSILPENTLGKRLKKARLRLGLSQEQLAIKCCLSRGAIIGYEDDLIHPSRSALMDLLKVIDIDYLCCDDLSKFLLSDYVNKLKNWRKDNNLSMRKAAKFLDMPSSTYAAWEKSKYSISRKNYNKIKDKFSIIAK